MTEVNFYLHSKIPFFNCLVTSKILGGNYMDLIELNRCNILVCTVLHYLTRTNVNTCPHSCIPLRCTVHSIWCTAQPRGVQQWVSIHVCPLCVLENGSAQEFVCTPACHCLTCVSNKAHLFLYPPIRKTECLNHFPHNISDYFKIMGVQQRVNIWPHIRIFRCVPYSVRSGNFV